ncbi:class I SAM-dependent methyltransferase [Tahibacter amnicola]|uniref:Methyltransferase n=1 Tax=Tahibacter amnicola TaxID=2976241 RepID=A0ABY6BK03_9GAMM|nr:methyltransferase [Tahibacter amnicola]UXI70343.1 methyltransferase [Tahibacter amnicola]
MEDAALRALFVPFDNRDLAVPAGPVAFLRARAGIALQAFVHTWRQAKLVAEQTFRPVADELMANGIETVGAVNGSFPLVLVLPARQRDEARAQLARALALAQPGGTVVASVANAEGAKSIEGDFRRLVSDVQVISKHKCRVMWARNDAACVDTAQRDAWIAQDQPQPIAQGRFLSRPGVFAWDRIDLASQLLAEQLPTDLSGQGADLGAGYGFLSAEVVRQCPRVTGLHLYEAEQRALELARVNLPGALAAAGRMDVAMDYFWHDVAKGLPHRYDFVVMNPPFHVGRIDVPELGRAFVRAAAAALRGGGRLLLVANRHLPYEQTLAEQFGEVRVLADAQGFKVISARKAAV